jgi:histone-lysine N-methyltransferase SETD1
LNKDASRDTDALLPFEKAAAAAAATAASSTTTASTTADAATGKDKSSASTMDVEHLPIAMQYRELRRRPFDERLEVRKSRIHGYGLFTKEAMVEGQMIVEYQGQMISQAVADARERHYEEMGIGSCYMFRLDANTIIDATWCGNLARFINHSCDPKAFARVVTVDQEDKKIVIFAKRALDPGDEVTYDYKFPIEETIRCDCGAGSLN